MFTPYKHEMLPLCFAAARPLPAHVLARMVPLLLCAAAALAPAAAAAADSFADEPRSLSFLGYHHDPHEPYLWVETNEPAKAWLVAIAPDHSRLHLEHAVMSRSVWGLPIDTACFDGPISSLLASPQEEPQTGVIIDIKHRPGTRLALYKRGSRVMVAASHAERHKRRRGHRPGAHRQHVGAASR